MKDSSWKLGGERCGRSTVWAWGNGTSIARAKPEVAVPEPEDVTVPIPATDTEAEHDRVRDSNDRDQRLERDGRTPRHNKGYDEAANGRERTPDIDRVVDEP
jgi:hypothetical protein